MFFVFCLPCQPKCEIQNVISHFLWLLLLPRISTFLSLPWLVFVCLVCFLLLFFFFCKSLSCFWIFFRFLYNCEQKKLTFLIVSSWINLFHFTNESRLVETVCSKMAAKHSKLLLLKIYEEPWQWKSAQLRKQQRNSWQIMGTSDRPFDHNSSYIVSCSAFYSVVTNFSYSYLKASIILVMRICFNLDCYKEIGCAWCIVASLWKWDC